MFDHDIEEQDMPEIKAPDAPEPPKNTEEIPPHDRAKDRPSEAILDPFTRTLELADSLFHVVSPGAKEPQKLKRLITKGLLMDLNNTRKFEKRKIKNISELNNRTRKEYEKAQKHIPYSQGPGAVLEFLLLSAQTQSPSRYKAYRAAALRGSQQQLRCLWSKKTAQDFVTVVQSLPPQVSSRTTTEITKTRRRKKDVKVLDRIFSNLRPQDAMAAQLCLVTGARQSELPSLYLEQRIGGIAVAIKNKKGTGTRNFYLKYESGGRELKAIMDRWGPQPCLDMGSIDAFRKRYTYMLRKEKIDSTKYSLHALRHQFASNQKKIFGKEGAKKVSERLGHRSKTATAIYGNSLSAI